LFGLDKFVTKIGLALRRVLEPKGGEFEVRQLPRIEEIYNLAAVHAVSGQPVGVPGDDALGLSGLNASHHVIELRAARFVR
jgi:hypothetical protein